MKSASRPLISALRGRSYAAQAAAHKVEPALSKHDPKITHLPNGAIVASIESASPISRVAVYYTAGSRYESVGNVGVTHCLRNASHLSTKKASGFAIVRNIEQLGGNFSCSTTREHLCYSLECLRSHVSTGVEFMGHAATSPVFKTWEVSDALPRSQLDLSILANEPHTQLMEALHKAAYRSGLGNSLFMPQHMVGKHTPEMLSEFVLHQLVSGNMTVVASGVDHDGLVFQVKKMKAQAGAPAGTEKSTYHGGEMRIDCGGPLAHVAIATEGASLGSKDLLALALLQKVMGGQPHIKYSDNTATSKISKAAAKAATSPFAASCINAAYSDSGLFGFQVVAHAEDMAGVLKALVGAFSEATKGSVSDQDVQRAKSQLRASMHMELEDPSMHLEDMAVQVMHSGQVLPSQDMETAINAVTAADIQAIAKKVINGKPTMAAVGNLGYTPYLDQLM